MQKSPIAAQLVCTLALHLNIKKTCPLTPVLIPGVENALTDTPSCSFGSVIEWECKTNNNFLNLFNQNFPLPNQVLWTVFQFGIGMTTRVISALRMKGITLAEWQRLPRIGKQIGKIGPDMSDLWGCTLSHRGCGTPQKCVSSQGLQQESAEAFTGKGSKVKLERLLALSRPLDRRSRWPVAKITQK